MQEEIKARKNKNYGVRAQGGPPALGAGHRVGSIPTTPTNKKKGMKK